MNKELKLEIFRDNYPMNPFEDWDCEPDLMYQGGRNYEKDFSKGAIVEFIKDKMTDGFIIRNQKALAEILNIDLQYFKDYNFSKEDKASDIRYSVKDADFNQLESICNMLKIPCTNYTSRGYSQGDWADVFIVLTDEFFERTGCDRKNSESILEGTAKLFDNWAWGDVYGFRVLEKKVYKRVLAEDFDAGNFEDAQEYEEWEEIDSFAGFFGNDFEENGMLEYLPEEAKHLLKDFDKSEIIY